VTVRDTVLARAVRWPAAAVLERRAETQQLTLALLEVHAGVVALVMAPALPPQALRLSADTRMRPATGRRVDWIMATPGLLAAHALCPSNDQSRSGG
jgi:hypothetical protein